MRIERVASVKDLETLAKIYRDQGLTVVWGAGNRSISAWRDGKKVRMARVNGDK